MITDVLARAIAALMAAEGENFPDAVIAQARALFAAEGCILVLLSLTDGEWRLNRVVVSSAFPHQAIYGHHRRHVPDDPLVNALLRETQAQGYGARIFNHALSAIKFRRAPLYEVFFKHHQMQHLAGCMTALAPDMRGFFTMWRTDPEAPFPAETSEWLKLLSPVLGFKALLENFRAPPPDERRWARIEAFCARYKFSPREQDVMRLLCEGATDGAIAETLAIGPRTVHTHVAALLRKTGSARRAELIARAHGAHARRGP